MYFRKAIDHTTSVYCEQIEVYKRDLAAVDPQAIVDFLVTWLVEHIQKTDQELARLLAN